MIKELISQQRNYSNSFGHGINWYFHILNQSGYRVNRYMGWLTEDSAPVPVGEMIVLFLTVIFNNSLEECLLPIPTTLNSAALKIFISQLGMLQLWDIVGSIELEDKTAIWPT